MKQLNSKYDVFYPVYKDREIDEQLCSQLGYDVNQVVKKEVGAVTKIFTLGKFDFKTIVFIGLGDSKEITTKILRKAFASAVSAVEENMAFYADSAITDTLSVGTISETFVETFVVVTHKETKVGHEAKAELEVEVLSEYDVDKVVENAKIVATCVNHTRDLGNAPSNIMTAITLSDHADALAAKYGLECGTLNKKQLEEIEAGAILAVNQGSVIEPRLIVLKYNGDGDAPYTALVGKGLTFDTGGYNIKPNSLGMKYDMCGGATVLGAMEAIAALKLKANVLCIVPATDSMISGSAYKPDDVITSLSKKTIEVLNTDAEGRIILCDAITYAQQLGAKRIIDVATLTGAIIVALGNDTTGVFSNSQSFCDEIVNSANANDEMIWQLPTGQYFIDQLTDTKSADIKNIATNGAGSSIGAAFLEYFVEEGVEWMHLDIAGSASAKTGPIVGATGAMVRTIVDIFK